MSGTRFSLYYLLMKAFRNSKVKKQACDSSKEILQKHPEYTNRIFDHFPCVIPDKLLEKKVEQFKEIIADITDSFVEINDKEILLTHEIAKTKIAYFEKAIAQMAIEELLTYKETLKPELMKLLDWEEFEDQLNKPSTLFEILRAYVGAVNQVIIEQIGKHPEKSNEVYGAICHQINDNYHHWILEKLDSEGRIYAALKSENTIKKWKYEKILRWPLEAPHPGLLVALTGVAAMAAYLFFKKPQDTLPEEKVTEKSFRI